MPAFPTSDNGSRHSAPRPAPAFSVPILLEEDPRAAIGNISSLLELPGGSQAGLLSDDFQVAARCSSSSAPIPLDLLVAGQIAGIHVRGLVSEDWCRGVTDRFVQHPHVVKEEVSPSIYTLGTHLYACGSGTAIECYFKELPASNQAIAEVVGPAGDPMIQFLMKVAAQNNLVFELLGDGGVQVEHGSLRL